MTKTAPSKIVLKSPNGRYDEGRAGGAITPGHLIALNGDSEVVVHGAATAKTGLLVAMENSIFGKTIDDAYEEGDVVRYWRALPGDVLYMILEDNHDVAVGDLLESAGDGTLQKGSGTPLVRAVEAVDTTGSPTATARVRVEVL